VDPPIVDGVNGLSTLSAVPAGNGNQGVLVQSQGTSFFVAYLSGTANQCHIHAPASEHIVYFTMHAGRCHSFVGGVTGTSTEDLQRCLEPVRRRVLYLGAIWGGRCFNSGARATLSPSAIPGRQRIRHPSRILQLRSGNDIFRRSPFANNSQQLQQYPIRSTLQAGLPHDRQLNSRGPGSSGWFSYAAQHHDVFPQASSLYSTP